MYPSLAGTPRAGLCKNLLGLSRPARQLAQALGTVTLELNLNSKNRVTNYLSNTYVDELV